MTNKTSLTPIVKDHLATLVDGRSGKPKIVDYLILYGIPIAASLATYWFDVRLRELGGVLGGLAVFTGLLFGLLVFVFQLRLQAAADPRLSESRAGVRVLGQIDELFANVGYAVVVGLVTTFSTMAAVALGGETYPGLAPIASALLVFLALHLVLVVSMCLKRAHLAYRRLRK